MSVPPPVAIAASRLTKAFGSTPAVEELELTVPAGGVYGLLGPNGAGKTTTIRMLATLLRPDAGTARVFGHDVVQEADAVRELISLTGQFASVDDDLTGLENLLLLARLKGYRRAAARRRADELLTAFDLVAAAGRQVKTYSGGMRRRLDLATSIVVAPRLLFLDEPTTGLDPHSRNEVWQLVRALVADGTTVLLTTQYLDEADQLAARIAVIDRGTVVAEGTPADLKAATGPGTLRLRLRDPRQRAAAASVLARVLRVRVEPGADETELTATGAEAAAVTHALTELGREGLALVSFALGQPSLDEAFLALTGHRPTGAAGTGTSRTPDSETAA